MKIGTSLNGISSKILSRELIKRSTILEVETKLRDLLDFIKSKNDKFFITSLAINNSWVRRL